MIALRYDCLVFTFPKTHPDATLHVNFQRTLRVPDDDRNYPLPPGLGSFPLRHLDALPGPIPPAWAEHGGVVLPMYQGEALWISLLGSSAYPFCVKVGTGMVNAVTGDPWTDAPDDDPQDYLVTPDQPWLDGYSIEPGTVRQFVAMPLGSGEAHQGGLQIAARPMKLEVYRSLPREQRLRFGDSGAMLPSKPVGDSAMGLSVGGRMKQEIFRDAWGKDAWSDDDCGRCFVHLANSVVWRAIAGEDPPTVAPTAEDYAEAGLPWSDCYSDGPALAGSKVLAGVRSVRQVDEARGAGGLPGNESVSPSVVVKLRRGLGPDQVREWPRTQDER
jgi:hypothetical protein